MNDKIKKDLKLTPELLQQADEEALIMILSQGTVSDGRPYWAYLAIPPSKFLSFKEAEAKGNFNLEDFGTIVNYGFDVEPPEQVKKEMEVYFDISHDYEKNLIEEAYRIKKEAEKEARISSKYNVDRKKKTEEDSSS